jgi:hypothetical protein
MLRVMDNVVFQLQAGIQPSSTEFSFNATDVIKLNTLDIGDEVFFTLKDKYRLEQCKYIHSAVIPVIVGNTSLPVVRAQLGSTAKSWAVKSLITTAITGGVVDALIDQKLNGECE